MKIAIIGAGGFAQHHLKMLAEEPGVEVVGHVSRTPESREAAAERWGGRAYASVKELLEHERLDAAWIVLPPHVHGDIEESLIARNIPFFVEKPLAADFDTAERIAARLRERGLVAGVGYNWRAMDTLLEVRYALEKTPPHLVLAAWHDATPPPTWWHRQETSGGQVVEQATHLFDLARYLVGEATVLAATADRHPRPDYPNLNVADVSTALLRFDTGAKGVFTATCLLEGPAEVYLKFVCEGLLITVTREGVVYDTGREGREVKLGESPTVRENRAFLEAVRQHNPALLYSSYEDALLTHRLCFDVLEASA